MSYLASLGTCERISIHTVRGIEILSEWFLVWYTLNSEGETGFDKTGSNNYTVAGFVDDYLSGQLNVPAYKDNISQLERKIEELKGGLTQPITITVASHNKLKKNLVVDGVKRTIALYYLKLTDSKSLEMLLSSNFSIDVLKFTSNRCHEVFPYDFQKLMKE
jgi:hypothetical protein